MHHDVVAVESAAPMFWVTDPDGSCTYLSDGWYAFTGQTPETGLGFGWIDAIHPDDRPGTERRFAAASAARAPFRFDYRLRTATGEFRWALDSASPRFAPDGTYVGFVGSVIDITDRKATEEALRESEARFRALFTSIDEGYCLCEVVLDDAGRPVDYRFLEANPLFAAMTGLADATGRTARELVPGLEDHWVETYARVALGGEPLRFEQGSEAMGRWFDVFATAVEPRGRFALVFKDVTQRKRADEALRRSEAAERRARQQAELLAEIGGVLEATEGAQARVQRLAELLVPRVADRAAVAFPGPGGTVVGGVAPARSVPAGALGALLPDGPDGAAGGDAVVAGLGLRAHLTVPLDAGPGARGTLLVGIDDPARAAFTDEDAAFLRKVAERVGVLLTRARLREEEHRIAVRLQQALLPDALLTTPGVGVAARYEAGDDLLEVGGDWYDAFALPGGGVGFAVGDVVGHGLEAAATMGRLRTALAALAPHAGGPGDLLADLDAYAVGPNAADFATACCAMLDPGTGTLRYASAGHPPMLVVEPDGEARFLEDGRSPALFGRPGTDRRPEASVALAPGALLVLYSDGLVERRREPVEAGFARLEAAVREARDRPVAELCEHVLTRLGVADTRDDDVVLLCVRIAAAPARLERRVPARPDQLRELRAGVRAWTAAHGIGEAQAGDLLLGLGEACTNAVEHAFLAQEAGVVEVEVAFADDGSGDLVVRVHDTGRWRPEVDSEGLRGRGTGIMRAVGTGFARRTGTDGTTVSFTVPAPV